MKVINILNKMNELAHQEDDSFDKFIEQLDMEDCSKVRGFGETLIKIMDVEILKRIRDEDEGDVDEYEFK